MWLPVVVRTNMRIRKGKQTKSSAAVPPALSTLPMFQTSNDHAWALTWLNEYLFSNVILYQNFNVHVIMARLAPEPVTGYSVQSLQFQLQPVYQQVPSPYIIHKKIGFLVTGIKQLSTHNNLSKMKSKTLTTS